MNSRLASAVALEFTAVVGEDGFDGEREHGLNQAKELSGGGTRVTAGDPSPAEVRMQIGAGDDVAAVACPSAPGDCNCNFTW